MIPINKLADEIIKIDAAIKDAAPDESLFLKGAVHALRWTMYPDLVPPPTSSQKTDLSRR